MEKNRESMSKDVINKDFDLSTASFLCRKCRSGVMQPAMEANELELTDTYICNHCGHKAIIPSPLIILSQLLCGLTGGLISGYLFIQEMSALMTALQFNLKQDMAHNTLLMFVSLIFLVGFGYTMYHGFLGMTIRRLYARYPKDENSSSGQ